jgi:hypothetical protein
MHVVLGDLDVTFPKYIIINSKEIRDDTCPEKYKTEECIFYALEKYHGDLKVFGNS